MADDAFLAGTHCSLRSCKALDFLPISCPFCHLSFCRDHASPADKHLCPSAARSSTEPVAAGEAGPSFKKLLPDRDAAVEAERRLREQKEAEKAQKNAAALAILHRNFPRTAAAAPYIAKDSAMAGLAKKSKKPLSPAIRLMKLKRSAKSVDPRKKEGDVPMERRWYAVVRYVDEMTSASITNGGEDSEEPGTGVWLDQDTIAGKALDLLEAFLRIPPPQEGSPPGLRLFAPRTRKLLTLSEPLGPQTASGEALWVTRGEWAKLAAVLAEDERVITEQRVSG